MTSSREIAGRRAELNAAEHFIERARTGPASLVLSGPAGAGKTTVWQGALAIASDRGFRVLRSRPVEAEAKLAFAGLTDLFEPIADSYRVLPAAQAAALDVALRRAPQERARHDALTISLGTLGTLRILGLSGPVLIAIDDLQWLDSPTARALQFAVRRLTSEPIGFLVTERVASDQSNPTVSAAMFADLLQRLEIGPLGVDALEQLLRDRLGVGFLRPTLLRIEQASGGNPFYALEIGHELLRRGIRFAPEVLPIPEKLSDIVRDRIAALSEPAADATLLAAVIASPTEDVLRAAMGAPPPNRDGIAESIQAGVLERDGDRLRFSHPLLASTAYELAGEVRRRAAHARAARALDEPEERARHLALASDHASERVASALERAASHARGRGATESAAELAELAYRRTPAGRPGDARRRAIQAADHLIRAGDPDTARSLLDEILAEAPPGFARAEVLVALAEAHGASDWTTRVALLEAAVEEAGETTPRIAAERLLAGAGLVMVRDLPGALEHARRAVQLAERGADSIETALCLAMVCRVQAFGTGIVDHATLARATEFEPALRDMHVIARPSFAYTMLVSLHQGRFDDARARLEACRAEALRIGDWDALPMILSDHSEVNLRSCDWPRAMQLASEAVQISHQIGQPGQRAYALNAQARVLGHQGRSDDARAALAEAAEFGGGVPGTANAQVTGMVVGFVELSLGRPQEAHDAMDPFVRTTLAAGICNPESLRTFADEIEALTALGRHAEALEILEVFEEQARAVGSPTIRGLAGRCRALIAAARGDVTGAVAHLDAALDAHAQAAEPFVEARTRLVLGEVLRRDRRIGAARRSLEAAAEQFDRVGAPLWAERARTEIGRLSGRPVRQGLTETERRIADLVALGRTNREVADTLFMSPHTVDSHLRRIYRLLGVRSRTELAHHVAADDRGSESTPTA